jgi:hypothetical protein
MSEDTESGATLAVLSVHENHIVNATSRQWVSDPFWVQIRGAPVEFRVQFVAKQVAESKRGLSFKKAEGLGKMELKCVGEPPEGSRFRVAFLAGPGVKHGVEDVTTSASLEAARRITRREAHCHDFGKYPTCGLNGTDEFWDFSSLVDKKKRAVFVGVEMLPQCDASEKEPNLEQGQACSAEIDAPEDAHTSWSTSTPTGSAVADAEQVQEEQFRIHRLLKPAILGPPLGLELIGLGPPPGLELVRPGPPPGLELIRPGPPPGLDLCQPALAMVA